MRRGSKWRPLSLAIVHEIFAEYVYLSCKMYSDAATRYKYNNHPKILMVVLTEQKS